MIDPNDYEVGKRHNLPFITIFDDNGNIIGDYGQFTVFVILLTVLQYVVSSIQNN